MKRMHMSDRPKTRKRPRYTCDLCGCKFTEKFSLRPHMIKMHLSQLKDRQRICPYCGEYKVYLDNHIKARHRKCEICEEYLRGTRELKRHMQTIHGIEIEEKKIFNCDECDKSFSLKKLLDSHKSK